VRRHLCRPLADQQWRSCRTRASVYQHDLDNQPGHLRTVSSHRPHRVPLQECRRRVLVNVNRVAVTHPVTLGVFNVRSLMGNKSAAVLDTIIHNSLDLFAAVETWHDSHESPSVIASTPPGFQVFERAIDLDPRRKRPAPVPTTAASACLFARDSRCVSSTFLHTSPSSCYLYLSIHVPCRSC